jgi:lysozyme family protein
MTFDEAFERLVGHEGNFDANPKDRGNWTSGTIGVGELKGTKFGIAAHVYPHLDIRNLTLEEARTIYVRDYWGVFEGHAAIKFQVFDAAVNHGRGNAIRLLQKTAGVAEDGRWGPISQAALDRLSLETQLMRYTAHRLLFWASLKSFDTFGRGWTRRGAENLLYAASDISTERSST